MTVYEKKWGEELTNIRCKKLSDGKYRCRMDTGGSETFEVVDLIGSSILNPAFGLSIYRDVVVITPNNGAEIVRPPYSTSERHLWVR